MQSKNNSKIVIQYKTRQQAENKKKQNKKKKHLETKNKQTNNKMQEPEIDMRNRKQGRKKITRERPRKIKCKRGEAKKRLNRNKGKHRKINNKTAFLGGKTEFFN